MPKRYSSDRFFGRLVLAVRCNRPVFIIMGTLGKSERVVNGGAKSGHVAVAKTMIEWAEAHFDLYPERLVADACAY